jgi:hypothetical protein
MTNIAGETNMTAIIESGSGLFLEQATGRSSNKQKQVLGKGLASFFGIMTTLVLAIGLLAYWRRYGYQMVTGEESGRASEGSDSGSDAGAVDDLDVMEGGSSSGLGVGGGSRDCGRQSEEGVEISRVGKKRGTGGHRQMCAEGSPGSGSDGDHPPLSLGGSFASTANADDDLNRDHLNEGDTNLEDLEDSPSPTAANGDGELSTISSRQVL